METGKINTKQLSIKENSWLAWVGAKVLRANNVALVMGRTIHLHNTKREDFLANERWVKHELCHIEQYQQYGTVGFLVRYLAESIRKGYFNNRFEVEARKAESA